MVSADTRKKVLVLTPGFPYPVKSGGQTRVYNLIKEVSRRHDITLLSFITADEMTFIEHMRQFCESVETVRVEIHTNKLRKVAGAFGPRNLHRTVSRLGQWMNGMAFQMCRFYDPEMDRKVKYLVSTGTFDVIHSTYAQLGPYLSIARQSDPKIATVLADIDLTFETMQRELATRKGLSRLLFHSEQKRISEYVGEEWTSFDKVIAMSEVDKAKLLDLQPDLDIAVIPNGVDTDSFRSRDSQRPESMKLIFLGGSRHAPNVDALNYFIDQIFGLVCKSVPHVRLQVVGEFDRSLLNHLPGPVEFTGYVEDVRPYLQKAAVLVVPVRVGGGTRLKILEAMALGLPVVSTSVGYEGIDAEPGRDVIVGDSPEEFANGVGAVLKDVNLRESLARNGRRIVETHYGWRRIADRLSDVYEFVTDNQCGRQR